MLRDLLFFWLCWGFVSCTRASLAAVSRGYSLLWCSASLCGGFSCCGAQALGVPASAVVAHRLGSCGTWAWLLRSMWTLPLPEIKPMSPALAGGSLYHQRSSQVFEKANQLVSKGSLEAYREKISGITYLLNRF